MKPWAKRFYEGLACLILGGIVAMTSFAFAEEIIELEYGRDADETYKTYALAKGYQYRSDDHEVVVVSDRGLIQVQGYGETQVHLLRDGHVQKTYLVVVYLVEEPLTPFGQGFVLKPFIQGFPGNNFKPDQAVTLAQGATMVARALDIKTHKVLDIGVDTHHWAYPSLAALVDRDLCFGQRQKILVDAYISKDQLKAVLETYSVQSQSALDAQSLETLVGREYLTRAEMVYYMSKAFKQEGQAFKPPVFKDVLVNHPYYAYIQQNIQ